MFTDAFAAGGGFRGRGGGKWGRVNSVTGPGREGKKKKPLFSIFLWRGLAGTSSRSNENNPGRLGRCRGRRLQGARAGEKKASTQRCPKKRLLPQKPSRLGAELGSRTRGRESLSGPTGKSLFRTIVGPDRRMRLPIKSSPRRWGQRRDGGGPLRIF